MLLSPVLLAHGRDSRDILRESFFDSSFKRTSLAQVVGLAVLDLKCSYSGAS